MRCRKAQIWLQGYVDGELSPRRMQRVRKHLERCPACQGEFSRLSQLKTLLAEHRSESAMDATPEFFWSQVQGRIKGETEPRRVWRRTLHFNVPRLVAWTSAATAMAAVAVSVFLWLQIQPKPPPVIVKAPESLPAEAKVEFVITKGPDLYAQAYHSEQSRATIIWTEGMPVISLEF